MAKYTSRLSEEDRLDIEFDTEKNKVVHFIVQYSSITPKGWRTIIRYDTAHGAAHKDVYCYSKKKKVRQEILGKDFNAVFTQAQEDIKKNWEKIKENYLFQ